MSLPKLPDLGQFFGDQGGPGMTNSQSNNMQTDAYKTCPFADKESGEFCTLDGAMCPFVGFNYRRCRKYTNNLSKGMSIALEPSANNSSSNSPPRLEGQRPKTLPVLQEAVKKGGPVSEGPDDDDWEASAADSADGYSMDRRAGEEQDLWGDEDYSAEADEVERELAKLKKAEQELAKAEKEAKAPSVKNKKASAKKPPAKKKAAKKETPKVEVVRKKVVDVKPENVKLLGVNVANRHPEIIAMAERFGHHALDQGMYTDEQKIKEMKEYFMTERTSAAKYFNPDDPLYMGDQQVANLLASMAHQVHNLNPGLSRQWGADFAKIAAAGAQEAIRAEDQYARDTAGHADARAGISGGAIFHDRTIQAHRPKGAPTSPDPEVIGATPSGPSGDEHPNVFKFKASRGKRFGKDAAQLRAAVAAGEAKLLPFTPSERPEGAAPRFRMGPMTTTKTASAETAPAKPAKRKLGVKRVVSRKATPGTRAFQAAPEETPAQKVKKVKFTGLGSDKSHAKQSSDSMTYEQFEKFVDLELKPLTAAERKVVVPGFEGSESDWKGVLETLKSKAAEHSSQKNYLENARAATQLRNRIQNIQDLRARHQQTLAAWDMNMDILKKMPLGDQEAYQLALRKVAADPKAQKATISFAQKLADKMYNIETSTMKVGGSEVMTFVRKLTVPVFGKSDYETVRMTQQLGLAAIHKHHQYGRGFGRWATTMALLKNIAMGIGWWFTKDERVVRAIMSWWPEEFLNGFYFSFVQKHLPKVGAHTGLELSRDDKFLASQKMNSSRSKKIMRGWHKDAPLPPDVAVMHSRWYPTTKETWGKRRQQELTARHQAQKIQQANLHAGVQFKTYLR